MLSDTDKKLSRKRPSFKNQESLSLCDKGQNKLAIPVHAIFHRDILKLDSFNWGQAPVTLSSSGASH
ncbi:MAG: hypothetical protein KAU21_02540, partial [Gammaproteobacteria bacterium]|nr:hypothetical protein [Gammaproteobacteria bacterium]